MRISDWSSDVCSSDLFPGSYGCVRGRAGDRRSDGVISNVAASAAHRAYRWTAILRDYGWLWPRYGLYPSQSYGPILLAVSDGSPIDLAPLHQLGRASCRERWRK